MRLYTLTGQESVKDGDTVYSADADGAFDFPDELSDHLHSFPGWEDDGERQARLEAEALERAKDPATLLAEVQKLTAALAESKPAPKPRIRKAAE